jgi:cell division protein ZapA (FtsZ GTPase activity inhibitor)
VVKRSAYVTIDGKQIPIRSQAEQAYLDSLAGYVEQRYQEVQTSKPGNPYRQAILAALNIADELFKERNEHRELKQVVGRRCRRIMELLDAIEAAGQDVPENVRAKEETIG